MLPKKHMLNRLKEVGPVMEIDDKGERLMDDLRWMQVAKNIEAGLLPKDRRAMDTFVQRVSPGIKKIAHLYPQQNNTNFMLIDCKVCFKHQNTTGNPVVYCERCDSSYHKWCYGIAESLEDRGHICDVCTFNKRQSIPADRLTCLLCRKYYPGIPLKQLRGNFFHVLCLFVANFGKTFLTYPSHHRTQDTTHTA